LGVGRSWTADARGGRGTAKYMSSKSGFHQGKKQVMGSKAEVSPLHAIGRRGKRG